MRGASRPLEVEVRSSTDEALGVGVLMPTCAWAAAPAPSIIETSTSFFMEYLFKGFYKREREKKGRKKPWLTTWPTCWPQPIALATSPRGGAPGFCCAPCPRPSAVRRGSTAGPPASHKNQGAKGVWGWAALPPEAGKAMQPQNSTRSALLASSGLYPKQGTNAPALYPV